ncbi:hypothetical protein ACFWIB_30905 [Streptomyces sp. NPDC127051]|uniref:hypothetical protein n=1 Tax=Streptomyces sp. NPDC127051 TaxID=3347119 RepID=UPI003659B5E6
MTTAERVDEIATMLNRRQWRPTDDEQRVGVDVLRRRREATAHVDREPATGRTTAEVLGLLTDFVHVVDREILPTARTTLGASPMVELIEAWADKLRTLVPYAERMRPLLEPGGDLTEYDVLTPEEGDAVHDAWGPIIAVGSVLTAAVTGNVDH